MTSAGVKVGSSDVVQGNKCSGADRRRLVYGGHDTIGGASPQLGNQIFGIQTGIAIGLTRLDLSPTPSDGNVVQNNTIFGNTTGGDGGVTVYDGLGNHIFENEIDNNQAANINLGGGPYRYNTAGGSSSGPNHFQPYPNVLDVTGGPTVTITGHSSPGSRTPKTATGRPLRPGVSCQGSVSDGQAYEWLGSVRVHADGIGDADFKLTVARSRAQHLHGPTFVSDPAFTLTATSADGSTSELSPCLTLGRHAPSFIRSGVSPTSKTIAVTPPPLTVGDTARAPGATATSKKPERLVATLRLLCPPVTARYCAGSFRFIAFGNHGVLIAHRSFKLVPGQVLTTKLPISKRVLAALKRAHRVRTLLTVIARDGKRHPDRRKTKAKLTLILKP